MVSEKVVLKHIINYLGSSFFSKLIVFFSAIVYSRFMSVEEFGLVNLYMSYMWIFVIVFSLNLYTSIGRYIYEERSDFKYFFSVAVLVILCISIFCTFVLISNIKYFEILLGLPENVIYMMTVAAIALILENIFVQIAIYKYQSATVLKITFFKSIISFALSIILLLYIVESKKYLAVIYAEFIVSICLILYIMYTLKDNFNLKYNKAYIKYMVNYSIPLMPYMLSLTLMSQSDRIMIDYFCGNMQTGLYSMAYNLGIVLVVVVAALLNAWNPSYFKYMNAKDYKKVEFGSNSIYLICFFITLLIILFAKDISILFLSEEYEDSLCLIGIVAIAGLASSIWQIWGRVIGYANKTYITSLLAVLATILNIVLNYYLLPICGYKIAAWTTLASYSAMGIISLFVSNTVIGYYRLRIVDKILPLLFLLIIYFVFTYLNIGTFYSLLLKVVVLTCILFFYKNKILSLKRSIQ